jgi:mevalonate kinase
MVKATSPGKFILFGEHAVVYAKPAIAVAVDLPLTIEMKTSSAMTVDNYPLDKRHHSFIHRALEVNWDGGPLAITIRSRIPSASGMGSSAAVTVATLGCVLTLKGEFSEEELARRAFNVEYDIQGKASPTDTSICTHGSSIMLAEEEMENPLWRIERGGKEWFVHHLDIADLTFVVGNTGIKGRTLDLVAKVGRFYEKSSLARETIDEIGSITLEGAKALRAGNKQKLGELMDLNHKRLSTLGVNHPRLQRLVEASSKYSHGAKLTGAGGGGSMVALTDEPEKVAQAIREAGGTPYIVRSSKEGVRVSQ